MKNTSARHKLAWQPNTVLIAKNTTIWLSQLSERFGQSITRLDQIPNEVLAELAGRGFTALWLIGIWQRSPASARIKQLYGRSETIASGYSILEYHVACELGGDEALHALEKTAEDHGIRLACDLVPNHTGLDAPWLLDHPDWYIHSEINPKADFSFESPNLCNQPGFEINLEEGYYHQSGAAEVFRFRQPGSQQANYIYHGNDGTSMPWNDTAQLNYLKAEVRQAMLDVILNVAQQFSIIRLDAAMTLVKQHYKRLWFPDKGEKKSIPTRSAHPMSDEEFDRQMPEEFWSEVVRALRVQAPDCLLIAEAFWLMEPYFIQEIGMHRVYNSAFMHQLRDEENLAFKRYIRGILSTDARMMERFVNFLTTPDETPAIIQFGKADKYLGACRLLACLPGLPMFGHGQWEGFREQYGMDIPRPMLAEQSDPSLVQTHQRLIAPLLQQRHRFSSAENFRLHDFTRADSTIDDNVLAFSNYGQGHHSLLLFNNSAQRTQGTLQPAIEKTDTITRSVSPLTIDARNEGQKSIARWRLLPIPAGEGESFLMDAAQFRAKGLEFQLGGYESRVFRLETE